MSKSDQKGANREPKGAKKEPKGSKKEPKWSQNGAKERPKCIKKSSFGKGRENERQGRPWARKLSRGPEFLGAIWRPFLIKNRKNGIQKSIQKSMSKKYRKMMPKGSQNDAKMDAKIDDFSFFSEFVTF